MVNELRFDDARCLFLKNCCKWEVSSRIQSLNLFMSTLCEKGRSDVALKIFLEMDYQGCCLDREKGCGEDVIIYRALLMLYVIMDRLKKQLKFLVRY
ncbi:hypothetical protein F8388_020341 [Cannabis sativa]|uniref:Pentatricopeptide repeat-containing protein n=1 Tax=Cannabis sativa TaxID=3483 RepID=A0A7J6DLX3_CANSA|nr:hypothetical protein G4B88_000140 [Cannabis sativa]KAF4352999.1 hypothetical protein G4B88_031061 [Cannabis sativa]KAF4394516.1 hypothetical protein F8388_020341 [Cannabis sativa]